MKLTVTAKAHLIANHSYLKLLSSITNHYYLIYTSQPIAIVHNKQKLIIAKNLFFLTDNVKSLSINNNKALEITYAYLLIDNIPSIYLRTPFSIDQFKTGINFTNESDCQIENIVMEGIEYLKNQEKSVVTNKSISGKMDKRLIYINRYIRKNYSNYVSLHDLADLINCSPSYLSNSYSHVFNISPIKHLQALRIEKAKKLLISGDENCSDIAYLIGYSSLAQFSTIFKKVTGFSPLNYRTHYLTSKS